MNIVKEAFNESWGNVKQGKCYWLLIKSLQITKRYLKKSIPRMIAFFFMLFIYSYIWDRYSFERMLMVILISIIIVLGSKK